MFLFIFKFQNASEREVDSKKAELFFFLQYQEGQTQYHLCSCQYFLQFFRFSAMSILNKVCRAFQEAFKLLSSTLEKNTHSLNADAWYKEGEHTWCQTLVKKLMLSAFLSVFCSYSYYFSYAFCPIHLDLSFKYFIYQNPFFKSQSFNMKKTVKQISMLAQVKWTHFQTNLLEHFFLPACVKLPSTEITHFFL